MKGTKILPLLSKQLDGCENLRIARLVIPSSHSKQLLNSSSRLLTVLLCLLKLRTGRNQTVKVSCQTLSRVGNRRTWTFAFWVFGEVICFIVSLEEILSGR